jgi:hypothetical protein
MGIAYWLGIRTNGMLTGVGAVVAGSAGGEIAMFAIAYILNASDPTMFPAGYVLAKAIGAVWIALLGSGLGLWMGRKKSRTNKVQT